MNTLISKYRVQMTETHKVRCLLRSVAILWGAELASESSVLRIPVWWVGEKKLTGCIDASYNSRLSCG